MSIACACIRLMFDYAYKQLVLFLSVDVHYDLLKTYVYSIAADSNKLNLFTFHVFCFLSYMCGGH